MATVGRGFDVANRFAQPTQLTPATFAGLTRPERMTTMVVETRIAAPMHAFMVKKQSELKEYAERKTAGAD
jgi:hypothetical protein